MVIAGIKEAGLSSFFSSVDIFWLGHEASKTANFSDLDVLVQEIVVPRFARDDLEPGRLPVVGRVEGSETSELSSNNPMK
jgi:hypothetical protein